MRTTRLLAGSGSSDGLDGALEEIAELEGLDEVTVGILLALYLHSEGDKY